MLILLVPNRIRRFLSCRNLRQPRILLIELCSASRDGVHRFQIKGIATNLLENLLFISVITKQNQLTAASSLLRQLF